MYVIKLMDKSNVIFTVCFKVNQSTGTIRYESTANFIALAKLIHQLPNDCFTSNLYVMQLFKLLAVYFVILII